MKQHEYCITGLLRHNTTKLYVYIYFMASHFFFISIILQTARFSEKEKYINH